MSGTQTICPSCHKPVLPGTPLGLCPECLVKSGFSTGTEPGAKQKFVPPALSEIARAFPQFEILGLIGQGGMGAVYQARQPRLDRLVALKVLPPQSAADPGFTERFNREARALARLSHPNIVAVHDFGSSTLPSDAGGPGNAPATLHYLLMEFVEGRNLREIERAGRMPPEEALKIIPQICDALQFAHNEGIIHRDIKPENILLDRKGRVKITDFGIAKMIGTMPDAVGLTGAQDIIGTPHYMAPEQVERPNQVDHRADIYSLGVVFYELLTGELPLGRFAPPSRKVQVDVRLDNVVLRALEKEPERRYQQAIELKTETQTITSTPPLRPLPPMAAPPVAAPAPKSSHGLFWKVAVVIAGVVGLAGVSVLMLLALFYSRQRTVPGEGHRPVARQVQPAAAPGSGTMEPRELSETEIQNLLSQLRSSTPAIRNIAASRLASAKPGARREEVETELLRMLTSPDWPTRRAAAAALERWGTADSVEALIKAVEDPMMSVRWAAISALAELKDERAIKPLAEHLAAGVDVAQSSTALTSFGAAAEGPVLELLPSKNPDVRHASCRILRQVGTSKSVPALTAAAGSGDQILALLANDALAAIHARR